MVQRSFNDIVDGWIGVVFDVRCGAVLDVLCAIVVTWCLVYRLVWCSLGDTWFGVWHCAPTGAAVRVCWLCALCAVVCLAIDACAGAVNAVAPLELQAMCDVLVWAAW